MMDSRELIDFIENAGYDCRSYSGRGMYGKACVGVTCGVSAACLVAQVIGEACYSDPSPNVRDTISDLCEIFDHTSEDSMGLSSIVYWTRMAWPEDIGSDDTEDSD